jgi:hypothetical protein
MHATLKAFEMARAEFTAQPDDHDDGLARDLLVKRILDAALEIGERDPERLKSYAEGVKL